MEGIPGAAATKISETVVDKGINEAYYLCCFNDIVVDLEDKKKDLEAVRRSVQDRVKQATNQTENISTHVKKWEGKADGLIQEDTKTKKACFFGWVPNCIWRYRRGKYLVTKTQEIKELLTEGNGFTKFALPRTIPDVEYYSSEGFVQFQSRDSAYQRLLEALENVDNYVIGLRAMGGAGKTTLAIEVGKKVKELNLFEHVIKVVVSYTPNIKNIQHEIASPLGLKLEDENELDRKKRLWQRLTNGEKILIILDDVWKRLDFEEIGIPSCSDHNNCRVLLTTRDIKVCNSMRCNLTIELELLPEQDAWLLFKKCAGLGEDSPETLKNKGREIARECKGLPIAIETIASTLRGEKEKDWDIALRSLRSTDRRDQELIEVYKRLQVSYDFLKSEEARELFLLCSVFPEDYEISAEDLTVYAIGLGLCGKVNSFEEARDYLHKAKKKLVDCCLLLEANEGNEECVKMHDLLRDLAHWIGNGKVKVIMGPVSNLNALQEEAIEKSSLRYLYCHNINDFPDLLDYPKLESLILEFDYKTSAINMPDTLFEGMKQLKVWTLDGYSGHKNLSLPKSVELLKSLRALTLRSLSLGDISVLQKLNKLESLRLEYCSINEVPSGIVQLKKLKLLTLKECTMEKNPCEVMGQIVRQLEELYFVVDGNIYGQADNEVIVKFLNKCPPLKRYQIELAEKGELRYSLNGSTSRALSIAHFDVSTSSEAVKDLVKRAEILQLHTIEGSHKTIIPDFVKAIGDMNELNEIMLASCSEIEFLIDTSKVCSSDGTNFSKLVKVDLIDMDHLKALCQGPPPYGFLENLREMKIGNCDKLVSLFTLPVAQSLLLLEELTIYNCEALESIITVDSEEKEKEIVDNDDPRKYASPMPKLKSLCVQRCNQLKHVVGQSHQEKDLSYPYHNIQIQIDFPALECLQLEELPNIISICQNNYHPKLLALKEFQLRECPQFTITTMSDFMDWSTARQLDCLTRKDSGVITRQKDILEQLMITTSQIQGIFNLEELEVSEQRVISTLKYLRLENLCGMAYLFKGPKQMCSLENLSYLQVKGCGKLKVIISTSLVRRLTQLKWLIIADCEALEQIVEDNEENQNIMNPTLKQGCTLIGFVRSRIVDQYLRMSPN